MVIESDAPVSTVPLSTAIRAALAGFIPSSGADGPPEIQEHGFDAPVEGIARKTAADLLILAIGGNSQAGLDLLSGALLAGVACPVLALVDAWTGAELSRLTQVGVSDFLLTPLRDGELVSRVARLLDQRAESEQAVQMLTERFGRDRLVGRSPALAQVSAQLPRIARCNATVLITGETGTGKEICARAIHYLGPRAGAPFVAVNCGALPIELVENELFGHEAGAFTSATSAKGGLVQEADGGTLFLDEVDALPAAAQVKLLRFLQEKEIRAVGSRKTRKADVRIIAAANTPLEESIRAGRFRRDLYYRINVLNLALPPLRDRREDIPILAAHFAAKFARESDRTPPRLDPAATRKLLAYTWPGNIRELENVLHRAVIMTESGLIRVQDLEVPGDASEDASSFQDLKDRALFAFEHTYLQTILDQHRGNISAAARAAKKNRRAFWELLRKHRLLPRPAAEHKAP